MVSLALLLLLQAAQPEPRAILVEATRAVEGDSVPAVSARWTARLSRSPADRSAQLGLATLELLAYHHAAALSRYATLLATGPADQFTTYALLGSGDALRTHSSLDSAASRYRRALATAREQHDSSGIAEAYLALSFPVSRSRGPFAALRLLDSAGRFIAPSDEYLLTRLAWNRAAHLLFGGSPDAGAEARRGLAMARRIHDLRYEGGFYDLLGGFALNVSAPPVAIALFDSAEALHRRTHDQFSVGISHVWRGFHELQLYDHAAARRDLIATLAQADSTDDRFLKAWGLRHLAHLEWHASQLTLASQHIAQAEALMEQLGDTYGLVYATEVIAGVAMDRGTVDQAEPAVRRELAWADSVGFAFLGYSARYGLAMVAMKQGRWADAGARLRDAAAFALSHSQQTSVPGQEYLQGIVALRQGKLTEAERSFRHYLATAAPDQLLDRYSARIRRAQLELQRGRVEAAERELVAAGEQLDSLRGGLADQQLRLLAFQTHHGYDDADLGFGTLISGLVAQGRVETAFRVAERRRARELRDHLARLASFHPAERPSVAGGEAIERLKLDDSTALLEYVAGADSGSGAVFALTSHGLSGAVIPITAALVRRIAGYASALESGHAADSLAPEISAAVLHPAIRLLGPAIHRLLVVPDGVLFQVPFEALPLSDGAPLLSRYEVALEPSAAVFAGVAARGVPAGPARVLAMGDPHFPGEEAVPPGSEASTYRSAFNANGGLPRLRGSAGEARAIARFAPVADVRLRASASEAFLKSTALTSYRVLHFATHALVDQESADRTVLAFAAGNGEDGFVGIGDVVKLQLDADLVVLSACQTAAGVVIQGEGVEGLTMPFLRAGARSVVASRWRIGDDRTRDLMVRLYRGLARGATVGEALRDARLEAWKGGAPASQWAAFTLVGNPGVRIPLREPSPRWPWILAVLIAGSAALLGWRAAARRTVRAA